MKQLLVLLVLSVSLLSHGAGFAKQTLPKDINSQDSRGQTATMIAASKGQTDLLKTLVSKKANLNLKDKNGNTALFFAISNEHTEAANILIDAGAELGNFNENGESALVTAVSFNNAAIIHAILKKRPRLLNLESPEKQTPIMKAAEVGSVETVRILVKAGADLKARDKFDRTAFDIAKESQNHESLKFLKPKK